MYQLSVVSVGLSAVLLLGCQSSQQPELDPMKVKKQISYLESQVSTLQLQVDELRSLQQQVAKFEAVQSDLDLIAKELRQALAQPQTVAQQQPMEKSAKTPSSPQYAIQLASTPGYSKVRQTYQHLKSKLPAEFRQREVNIEKVTVNEQEYYRLKLGAYHIKKAAFEGCKKLQDTGLNCLVTHYTSHRL